MAKTMIEVIAFRLGYYLIHEMLKLYLLKHFSQLNYLICFYLEFCAVTYLPTVLSVCQSFYEREDCPLN